tara:strand:+ start:58 stop:354 length:297 start_codon:yes stop_codon:yes gene_type:complete
MAQLQTSHLMSFTAQQPPKTISGNSIQSNSTVSISNANGGGVGSSDNGDSRSNVLKDISRDINDSNYVGPSKESRQQAKQVIKSTMSKIAPLVTGNPS